MKKNLGNLMLDIESFSNKSNSALVSLSAIEFDMKTGDIGRIFYEKCSLKSSMGSGLRVDADTIEWWMQQSEDAKKEVIGGEQHLSNMLRNFTLFIENLGTKDLQIWGNPSRFDLGILEDAYSAVNKKIPWKFVTERDVRTLVSFYPDIKRNEIFVGTKHNPVDDCKHQIKYCVKIWNKLKK